MFAQCVVETQNPKTALLPFFVAPVAIGVFAGLKKGFFGGAKIGFSSPSKSFGHFNYFFSSFGCGRAAFNASHSGDRILTFFGPFDLNAKVLKINLFKNETIILIFTFLFFGMKINQIIVVCRNISKIRHAEIIGK